MTATCAAPEADPQVQVQFGLWWPASDPDRLRTLAAAWEAMAAAIDAAAGELADHRGAVTGANEGAAIDAFSGFLEGWTGSHLPEAADHCRELATACREFAGAVDEARDTIRQLAIEIAASIAIGAGLAILTAGISTGAAATFTAAAVARAGFVATSLAARVIAILSRVVAFAGVGAFEAGATNLVIQTGRNAATNPNHDPFSGYNVEELGIATAGGALFGVALGSIRSVPLMRGVEPALPPPLAPAGTSAALTSTQRARHVLDQWHRATFANRTQSIRYHVAKHGNGRTAFQYTRDAQRFFSRNRHLATRVTLRDGSPGLRIQTKVSLPSGGTRNVGGYWTPDGRLVTFFD